MSISLLYKIFLVQSIFIFSSESLKNIKHKKKLEEKTENNEKNSINEITNDSISQKSKEPEIKLLGFDNYNFIANTSLEENTISFMAHFLISNINPILQENLHNITFNVNLNYKEKLRNFKETKEIFCEKIKEMNNKYTFNCKGIVNKEPNKISLNKNSFKYNGIKLGSPEMDGISELIANNIQKQNNILFPENNEVLILSNSSISTLENKIIIIEDKNNSVLDNISETCNLLIVENNELKTLNPCELTKISESKYSINCNTLMSLNKNLKGNKIIIGDEQKTLLIKLTSENNMLISPNRVNNKKKSGGLSTGGIVAIIIPVVLVLIAVTIFTKFFKGPFISNGNNQINRNIPVGVNSSTNIKQ